MTTTALSGPAAQLEVFIRARYPVIWITTTEEARVEREIRTMHAASGWQSTKDLLTWTYTRGVRSAAAPDEELGDRDPIGALQYVTDYERTEEHPYGKPAIAVFKGLHAYLQEPLVVRALQDFINVATSEGLRTLIVIAPSFDVPPDLQRQIALLEWPLPDAAEMARLLEDFIARLPEHIEVELDGDRERIAHALCGLTEFQADSVLATAVIATGRLDQDAIEFVIQEKARLIKASGLVELFRAEDLPGVGGLDLLKAYLHRRRRAFSDDARAYGAPMPRGLLLVGVPGTGKSLACKTLAKLWMLPLLRLDVGALMGSLVGQSEANIRGALAITEAVAPAILWLDELEKGLSGIASSGQSDAGTTARVFSTFLTWMQERTAPVYVVATSNDIEALPPELLRAGRFDDIVFVDLPNPTERAEIWDIHLQRVGRDPAAFDIESLVTVSEGYTGAEIEASVGEALYVGFDEDREITSADLIASIAGRVPLTTTMAERIDALRDWATKRAKPASSQPKATPRAPGERPARSALIDV